MLKSDSVAKTKKGNDYCHRVLSRGNCPLPVALPVIVTLICPHLDPSVCLRLMMLFGVLTNNAVNISMQKIHKKWKQIFFAQWDQMQLIFIIKTSGGHLSLDSSTSKTPSLE